MQVISNTGPLIALSKINQLTLLEKIFGKIIVPPMVFAELFSKLSYEITLLEDAFSTFIEVSKKPKISPNIQIVTKSVDAGEKEVLALAHNTNGMIIIDDNQARKAANKLGIQYSGSVGVLLMAKQRNYISNIKDSLKKIQQNGYFYSNEIIEKALMIAGEL